MNKVFLLCLVFFSLSLFASPSEKLEEFKMRNRFGIGISGGGPLAVLGVEVDVNINEEFSLSGGLGSGLDYSTLMVKGKYYLMGESVSPYFAAGFARWWTNGTRETNVGPAVLKNKFLEGSDHSKGFSVWMVYPAFGVQFIHMMGFSIYAELQYLFKLPSLANGTYAGLGVSWYF